MSAPDFGDIEAADSYDPTATIDPLQLAARIHELRAIHGDMDGDTDTSFFDLPPDVQKRAVAIALAVIVWLRREGHDV